jgi:glycosyltransferase involved in cell wall biosynthesis
VEVVERFARHAPFPVRLMTNVQRLGVRDNFILASTQCMGDLVAFCDQDDIWLPSKLEALVRRFSDPRVMLAVHSASISDSSMEIGQNRYLEYPSERRIRSLHFDLLFATWGFTMVFRRGVADIVSFLLARYGNRPECASFYHDTFVQMVSQMLGDTVVLKEILAIYRRHGANVTGYPPPPKFNPKNRTSNEVLFQYLHDKVVFSKFFSECFGLLEKAGPEDSRMHARYAAAFFEKAAKDFASRAEIYDLSSSSLNRIRSFFFLVYRRAYRPHYRYGFGYLSFFRDALLITHSGILRPGSASAEPSKKLP